jgi:hypothetical protein
MKRGWDLLRWLLNESEACGGGHPIVLTNDRNTYRLITN